VCAPLRSNPRNPPSRGFGREIAQPRHFNEHAAEVVERTVQTLLSETQEQATALIRQHRSERKRLIVLLEEKETLQRDVFDTCLKPTEKTPRRSTAQSN
jgi:ATP-dependent Zn protease